MNSIRPFYFFLGIGILLSIFFSSGQVENPDTHLRLTQARVLIEEGVFSLPRDVGEISHGNIAINESGQRHMVYNPGQMALFAPAYFIMDAVYNESGRAYYATAFWISFLNYIIHAICAYVLFKIALVLGSTSRKAYIVSLVFCLTSYSFSFAQSTYEHHFEMLFILLSVYFLLSKSSFANIALSGIAISIGLLFRTTTILVVPALFLLLSSNKQRAILISFIIPGVLAVLYYNFFRFGSPLESGYPLAWELAHNNTKDFWSIKRVPKGMVGFLVSPVKGILFFSPTVLIGVLGYKKFWKEHKVLSRSILVLIFCYLFLFSSNFAWHGSIWSFGPRYILPIIPFLYLPLLRVKFYKWVYVLILVAFLGQLILISVNYKRGLLEEHIRFGEINEQEYIFDYRNIPYLVQWDQLMNVLPKNMDGQLSNYFPNSAWEKESRISTNKDVLESSIEMNSLNFWWVRIFHWESSCIKRGFSILVLLGAIVFLVIDYRHITSVE